VIRNQIYFSKSFDKLSGGRTQRPHTEGCRCDACQRKSQSPNLLWAGRADRARSVGHRLLTLLSSMSAAGDRTPNQIAPESIQPFSWPARKCR